MLRQMLGAALLLSAAVAACGRTAPELYRQALAYRDGHGVTRSGSQAVKLFQRACDGGHNQACVDLADMYDHGRGVPLGDSLKAALLYQRATLGFQRDCDGGAMTACSDLAGIYAAGLGVAQSDTLAAEFFQRACAGGEKGACMRLARLYSYGSCGVPMDAARGVQIFQRACEGGDMQGCAGLADLYSAGMMPPGLEGCRCTVPEDSTMCEGGARANEACAMRNEVRAAELYQQACDGGYMRGCLALAAILSSTESCVQRDFDDGYYTWDSPCIDLPPNVALAVELFQRACDGGEMGACNQLGQMYTWGFDGMHSTGVPRDIVRGLQFLQRACDGGDISGCSWLGQNAHTDWLRPRNNVLAVALQQRACDAWDSSACQELARWFHDGDGVTKDSVRADALVRQVCADQHDGSPECAQVRADGACASGDMRECFNMAALYMEGRGVPMDAARGIAFYHRACDGGYEEACTIVKRFSLPRPR